MTESKPSAPSKRGRKRRPFALFLVLLAGAGLAVWLTVGFDREPRFQGKSISHWFEQAIKGTNVDAAFQSMGRKAAPFLARALEKAPSSLDEELSDFSMRPHVPEVLRRHSREKVVRIKDGRRGAARLLSELGPEAEPALPVLLRIFREGDEDELVQTYVNNAFVAMGDRIAFMVPELLQNLTNNQPHIRVLCARILGSIGPKAKPAVPALLEATESSEWSGWLALAASKALMNIDGQTNVTLRVLTNALKHTNSTIRQFALMDLRELGPAAKGTVLAIQEALRDPDAQVREEASKALSQIDTQGLQRALNQMNEKLTDQVNRLIEMVRTAPFPEQIRAVETLSIIGPDARNAVPVLMDVLRQTTVTNFPAPVPKAWEFSALNSLRTAAANALGAIGPEAHAATLLLAERARDEDAYTAIRYCRALRRIGPDAAEAIPALLAALDDANANIRVAAAGALIRIDPRNASTARTALKKLEDYSEPMIRLAVRVGLWELDRTRSSPLADLIAVLKKRDESSIRLAIEKTCAAELLGDLGPAAKEAIPLLAHLLQGAGSDAQRTAANAIRNIDPEAWAQLGLPGTLAQP